MSRSPITVPVPDLGGRRAIVTGGSDGLGLELAASLAGAGAEVLLPVRSRKKGEAALQHILGRHPGARVSLRDVDLSSLASVRELAATLAAEGEPISMLVANAGVMTPPERQLTADGFELQFGTNHLGHFALIGGLLPLLRAGQARVVSQLSVAADRNRVNWSDLQWQRRYHGFRAYSSSKIALGLFALELQRRSALRRWGITSNVSHPGVAPTALLAARPEVGRTRDTAEVRIIRALSARGLLVGTPETASLPALVAATVDGEGGRFFGPGGFGRLGGAPLEQRPFSRIRDERDAARIWDVSERLTGVSFSS